MRAAGRNAVRRKLRNLSLRDYPASVDSPPSVVTIEPGDLRVRFRTLEELAEAMLYLVMVFTHDLDASRLARLWRRRSSVLHPITTELQRAIGMPDRLTGLARKPLPSALCIESHKRAVE